MTKHRILAVYVCLLKLRAAVRLRLRVKVMCMCMRVCHVVVCVVCVVCLCYQNQMQDSCLMLLQFFCLKEIFKYDEPLCLSPLRYLSVRNGMYCTACIEIYFPVICWLPQTVCS